MKKVSKLLIVIQALVMTAAFALPAKAAINIGSPVAQSGSVVTIKSYQAVQTQTTVSSTTVNTTVSSPTPISSSAQAPSVTQPVTVISNKAGSVVSLKGLLNQQPVVTPSPATTTPAPSTPAPTTQTSSTLGLPPIPPATELTADEQLMVDMINQERVAAGLNPVKVDLRLVAVARAKAEDMKTNKYFGHTSPVYGTPWAMEQQVGLRVKWGSENIDADKSVAGSMADFMQSIPHRVNILDPKVTHIGVGIAYGSIYGNIYVQEFLQE